MSNVVYPLIIFLFVFAAGAVFLNATGMYTYKLPESGLSQNTSQALDYNTALKESSTDANTFNLEILWQMGAYLGAILTAILTLDKTLAAYGVPMEMILFVLAPLGVVLVFWIIEMWLGRSVE